MANYDTQWYYVLNNQRNGPVLEGVIQQLLQTNTINGETLTWKAGMPNWLPLRETSLCSLLPAGSVPPTAPAPAPYTPAPAYTTPASTYPQQPYGQPAYYPVQDAQKKATTALVLSIISLFCFAIILGPIALVNAGNAKKVLRSGDSGYGSATAAQVISWISIALWALGIIIYFVSLASSNFGSY